MNKAKSVCKLHDNYVVEAMIAIGKPGKTDYLPQNVQDKETPSSRKPLEKLITDLNEKS